MSRGKSSRNLSNKNPPNEGRDAMSATQNWIVCEQTGRWAAALRVAFARSSRARSAPRLYELRSLVDLAAPMQEHLDSVWLVEVRQANLAEVLELLAHGASVRPCWCAALLDDSLWQEDQVVSASSGRKQEIIDVFWEAGMVEVVESPRQLSGLLALHERLAAACCPTIARPAESQAVADWAWSSLPWQDSRR
jgi:hypothetical protein